MRWSRGVYCAARGGTIMGAKADALAKQFEAKVQEATSVLEKLSDADWKKVTAAEKWPVGVTAHHVAGSHEGIANIIKAVVAGQSMGNFTMDMLNEMNAQHAKEHANCTKADTIALHKKNAATAAAVVRAIVGVQLLDVSTVAGAAAAGVKATSWLSLAALAVALMIALLSMRVRAYESYPRDKMLLEKLRDVEADAANESLATTLL